MPQIEFIRFEVHYPNRDNLANFHEDSLVETDGRIVAIRMDRAVWAVELVPF